MKTPLSTAATLLLALLLPSTAHPTSPASPPPLKKCTDYTIPLTITSNNLVFGFPKFQNNFDVADFVDTLTSRNTTTADSTVAPTRENVTATYTISGTFCTPAGGPVRGKKTVLLATHGLGFDRSYVSYLPYPSLTIGV